MNSSLLGRINDAELAAFCCCKEGAPDWQREVEDYLRGAAVRRAQYVLGLRKDEGELVGVSAFDPKSITGLPVRQPIEVRGWRLLAVGIALDDQGQGHARALFIETLTMMLRLDRSRSLVKARVHEDNTLSLRACASAGIEPHPPPVDGYLQLIGAVPGTSPPDWFGE